MSNIECITIMICLGMVCFTTLASIYFYKDKPVIQGCQKHDCRNYKEPPSEGSLM